MLKTIALKRSTVLGELTVWFGPKAMKFIEDLEKYHHGIRKYYNAEIYADRQLDQFLRGGKLDSDVEVLNQIDKVPDRGHRFPVLDESNELHFGHPVGSKTVYKERKGVFEPKGTMPVEGDSVAFVEENNKEHRSRQVGQITDGIVYTEDRFMYDLLGFKEGRFRVLKRKTVEEEAQGFSFRSNDGEFFFRIRTRGNYFLWSAGGGKWEESDKRMHEAVISTLDYIRVGPVIVEEWIGKIKKQGLLG